MLGIFYSNPGLPVQYTLDSDPTAFAGWGGTNAEQNSILYRLDAPSIYIKSGPNNTDWTLIGQPGTIPQALTNVFNQGVPIANNPHTFVDFTGDGVHAFDNGGGEAKVVIPISAAMVWGASDIVAAPDTRFLGPGQIGIALDIDVQGVPVPYNTTLDNFMVRHNVAAGNGNSVVYTVMLDGVPTALSVTVPTGVITLVADFIHGIPASAEQIVSIRATKAADIGDGAISTFASMRLF